MWCAVPFTARWLRCSPGWRPATSSSSTAESSRWRRCSSLSSNRRPEPRRWALVAATLRGHRFAVALWVLGGSSFMYVMAMALAQEMAQFPGGADAFAASLRPGAEALRPMRWPADRLDTLGGYLTYHNFTLYTLLLSVYAAVQGSRAVRGSEERHSLVQVL